MPNRKQTAVIFGLLSVLTVAVNVALLAGAVWVVRTVWNW